MNFNFHTHTKRCGHAVGEDEEYVLKAIAHGFTDLGFSDHVPLLYNCGKEGGARIKMKDAEDYARSVILLKEKYKDKINIHLGFECEYLDEYFDKTLANVIKWGAEYIILGQHFYIPEFPENPAWQHVINQTDNSSSLIAYTDSVIKAMRTGKFSYVAHPDMFNFVGDSSLFRREAERLCVESKALNIPLELNLLGIRGKRNYPFDAFWAVAGGVGCPVTMGCDAHSPDDLYNADAIKTAKHLIEKYKLNYIAKPTLIPLR